MPDHLPSKFAKSDPEKLKFIQELKVGDTVYSMFHTDEFHVPRVIVEVKQGKFGSGYGVMLERTYCNHCNTYTGKNVPDYFPGFIDADWLLTPQEVFLEAVSDGSD